MYYMKILQGVILVIEKSEDEFEKFTNQFISSNAFKKRLIKLKSILKNV